ncbi:ribosomal protein S18-alanine N-acetyltransferase [Candidatus Nitrotoga sp. 1052]|uniref:ribosomal protein S18-alanine N-acetyltransferase n=1 Tax=Candidatus Nitrotoga sp. 1052 TaxID=2886964 RepID=UPI001EF42214|nr:ribosomal protein S18-alanine N-acetyltransferase [Candidatus Nitrotoga sp. 1052]CAH1075320.1 (Ribosomal protein S18)-alanine N-acetyltransferase [Candidatus Nitrotoga sp. 1052]
MSLSQLLHHTVLRDMNLADLAKIVCIEQRVHACPWSCGNFTDALNSNYVCKVCEAEGEILGYVVFMLAVDEAHLLNIGIVAEYQRKGVGRWLLDAAMEIARACNMLRMLLEVRPSNAAALGLYRDVGFREIGLRRGYYAADNGREDAVVMEYLL